MRCHIWVFRPSEAADREPKLVSQMRLGDILPTAAAQAAEIDISSLAFDDRDVSPGGLFFCVSGLTRDGHDFAGKAMQRGAVALVVERSVGIGIPEVVVPDVRAVMGAAANNFERSPSTDLSVVGITGTNGKTTSAWLVRSLLEAAGVRCGLVGTVATLINGVEQPAVRTTPEAIDLHRLLRRMADEGDRAAAIEVSSHALELGRVNGVSFEVGVFTNLTQDHLDFHGTLENYWLAKRRLFDEHSPKHSVVNVDDPYGAKLARELSNATTVGLDEAADWSASDVDLRIGGSSFTLRHPGGTQVVESRLPGLFNVRNILGAAAAVGHLGVSAADVASALASIGGVPGRFESIDCGQPFAVLVDYAHTPDSLENVLKAARALTDARVICVVGCGGDRDRTKRPLMGGIAADLADVAIVTSDNPRSEDPAAIVAEVAAGAAGRATEVLDRAEAIRHALDIAGRSDVVLIAGKGHEQGQEFADGHKVPFDDRLVAREALAEDGWA